MTLIQVDERKARRVVKRLIRMLRPLPRRDAMIYLAKMWVQRVCFEHPREFEVFAPYDLKTLEHWTDDALHRFVLLLFQLLGRLKNVDRLDRAMGSDHPDNTTTVH